MRMVVLQRHLSKASLRLSQTGHETDAQLPNQVSVALIGAFIFFLTREEEMLWYIVVFVSVLHDF